MGKQRQKRKDNDYFGIKWKTWINMKTIYSKLKKEH